MEVPTEKNSKRVRDHPIWVGVGPRWVWAAGYTWGGQEKQFVFGRNVLQIAIYESPTLSILQLNDRWVERER
jgi:hypothetical protein